MEQYTLSLAEGGVWWLTGSSYSFLLKVIHVFPTQHFIIHRTIPDLKNTAHSISLVPLRNIRNEGTATLEYKIL
jgi:hypothetical protein